MCKLPEGYKYSPALFYETGIDNPSINSGRFPGALPGLIWCRSEGVLYSFVGVLQAAQKPSRNTEQWPLKFFGRPATAEDNFSL
jgi:hypothetical protein